MLYRKYRPKILSEIYGQPEVVEELKREFSETGFAKGYVITGEKGTGKTSVGRILVSSMLCENFSDEGCCGKCTFCKKIRNGTLEEFIEVDLSVKESVISLEKELSSENSKGRFFLIKNAELMSLNIKRILLERTEAEENPIVSILISEEIIEGVESFKNLHLKSLNEDSVMELLKIASKNERYKFNDEILSIISKSSNGNIKKAFFLLERAFNIFQDECTLEDIKKIVSSIPLKTIKAFYKKLLSGDKERIMEWVETVDRKGADAMEFLTALEDFVAEDDILETNAEFRLKISDAIQQTFFMASNFPQMNNLFYFHFFITKLFPYAGTQKYESVKGEEFFFDEIDEEKAENDFPFESETLKGVDMGKDYSQMEIEIFNEIGFSNQNYIDIDIEKIKENWDLIIMKITSENSSLGMTLKETVPRKILNGSIYIAFPSSCNFLYNRIKSRNSDIKTIERIINNEFASKAKVCFELLTLEEEAEMAFKH